LWAISLRLLSHYDWRILVRCNNTVTYKTREDFQVLFFTCGVRELTDVFDSNLADVRITLFRQSEMHLCKKKRRSVLTTEVVGSTERLVSVTNSVSRLICSVIFIICKTNVSAHYGHFLAEWRPLRKVTPKQLNTPATFVITMFWDQSSDLKNAFFIKYNCQKEFRPPSSYITHCKFVQC
jgi:hypothetical protein